MLKLGVADSVQWAPSGLDLYLPLVMPLKVACVPALLIVAGPGIPGAGAFALFTVTVSERSSVCALPDARSVTVYVPTAMLVGTETVRDHESNVIPEGVDTAEYEKFPSPPVAAGTVREPP